jgi:hypothetical protein
MQRFNHNMFAAFAVAGLTLFATSAVFAHGGGGGHGGGRSSGGHSSSGHSRGSSGHSHAGKTSHARSSSTYRGHSPSNFSRLNPRYPKLPGGFGVYVPGLGGNGLGNTNNNPPVTVVTGNYPGTVGNNNPPVTVVTGNYPGTPGTNIPPGIVANYPPCPGFPRCPLPHRHWAHFHIHWFYGADGSVQTVDAQPIDVETIAIKFIDAGDPSQGTGPAYRVTVRNNTDVAIDDVFDLTLAASNTQALTTGVPVATTWIDGMQASEVRDFDIRLPVAVDTMGPTQDGQPTPFSVLSAMTDSQNRLIETNKENNLLVMNRTDIPSVSDE